MQHDPSSGSYPDHSPATQWLNMRIFAASRLPGFCPEARAVKRFLRSPSPALPRLSEITMCLQICLQSRKLFKPGVGELFQITKVLEVVQNHNLAPGGGRAARDLDGLQARYVASAGTTSVVSAAKTAVVPADNNICGLPRHHHVVAKTATARPCWQWNWDVLEVDRFLVC